MPAGVCVPAAKHNQLVVVWVIHCHMAVPPHRPVPPGGLQVPLQALAGHPVQLITDTAVLQQLAPKHIHHTVHLSGVAATAGLQTSSTNAANGRIALRELLPCAFPNMHGYYQKQQQP